jgi:mannose-1-phosphate guanylyltransferase
MKALLLAGGLGTRLYPLTRALPQALLPVCDREVLHYQITQLAMAGISEIVLAAGAQLDLLSAFASHYGGGLSFLISEEPEPLGTAGAIAQARRLLDGEPVLVLQSDSLSSIKLADVIAAHEQGGRSATVVACAVQRPGHFQLLEVNGGTLTGIVEQPAVDLGPGPQYANTGVYVLEPAAYHSIASGVSASLARDILPRLLGEQGALTAYVHQGLWLELAALESYCAANFSLLARRYALGEDWLWGQRDDSAVFKDLVYINKSAQFGRHVDLYHRVIVMAGARLGDDCFLRNCLVMPQASIGEGCRLTDCIVGPGAEVESGSHLVSTAVFAGEAPAPFFPHAEDAG